MEEEYEMTSDEIQHRIRSMFYDETPSQRETLFATFTSLKQGDELKFQQIDFPAEVRIVFEDMTEMGDFKVASFSLKEDNVDNEEYLLPFIIYGLKTDDSIFWLIDSIKLV